MDISPRSGSKGPSEPVDDWLKSEGYFRKNAPHDATCLFRAVSEQIYLTQYYHLKVRGECVEFMRQNKEFFEEDVKIPFDNYLEQLSCVTEWGGPIEIQAMSQLYKRDIVIFNATKLEKYMATDNGFKKFIRLCQMGAKVYESVFEREMISAAAFCQSIMYQTLYKTVFKMPSIDSTVQRMLHDNTSNMRHDKFFHKTNVDHRDHLTTELFTKIDTEDNTSSSKPKYERAPFPYRVAKALDPNIYRNIDFDIWQEMRKEVRWTGWTRWNDSELQIGAKCLVQLDDTTKDPKNIPKNTKDTPKSTQKSSNPDQTEKSKENSSKVPALLIGHIQEMSKNEGPVVVFIEELGEKRTVPFTSLKPLLATRRPQLPLGVISPRKHESQKYRSKHSTSRKSKESSQDSLNNNEPPKKPPSPTPPQQSPTVVLKPFTSVENYQSNNFMNAIEVRPVSIVLDNPPPLMPPGGDSRVDKDSRVDEVSNPKPSVSPMNNNNHQMLNNNNPMMNNNNLSQVDAYEKPQGQSQTQGPVQGQMQQMQGPGQPPGHPNEASSAPPGFIQPLNHPSAHQEPQGAFYPPIYPQAPIMCVSSEGMYPVGYYQPPEVPQGPPPVPDRSLRPINMSAGPINISAAPSTDLTGADLPYSDPGTLRFFYNLGVESFRWGQMCYQGSIAYGAPFMPPGSVVGPVGPSGPVPGVLGGPGPVPGAAGAAPPAVGGPEGVQTPRREEDAGYRGYQGKRRDERIERNSGRNSGMSGESRGSFRGNYPRREEQRSFQRVEGNGNGNNSSGYEYKSKGYGEEKDLRDQRDQRDQRKNGNRFNINNTNNKKLDNRPRNFERNNTFQGYQRDFRGDNGAFRREQTPGNVQNNPQGPPNQQFQGNYQQQTAYNEQQTVYYQNEAPGYYPAPSANFYPVGFMQPPQEGNEGGGGFVGVVENFQPPMYPQFVYPPPGVFPGVSGDGNWVPLGAGQGFVPYQVPVSQPPPNMVRPGPATSS